MFPSPSSTADLTCASRTPHQRFSNPKVHCPFVTKPKGLRSAIVTAILYRSPKDNNGSRLLTPGYICTGIS
ncbi:unnamed protein product, partial [Nesidiocoris tenuis]